MARINVVKLDQKEADPLEVADQVAEATFNPFLIKDAVVYQQAKLRRGNAASKTRSMVVGSGRKLFRQKGTGSARPGNAKAPHRRGGGVAHGPHPRDYSFKLNKKVRKAALRSAIAEKLRQKQIVLVDDFTLETHKTKALLQILERMDATRSLIVVDALNRNLELAARNLKSVEVIHHRRLNVYNLLRYPKTVVTRNAMEAVQERLTR